VGGRSASEITDDQCFITLRHANGSISSIGYLSGGDRAFPKERVEIFGGGRVAVIDDFREVTTCVDGKLRRKKYLSQDKGYKAEMEVLAKTLISGTPSPISWEEIRSVSLASILAVRSIREGIAFEVR
jgi:predicted dehydrogenase